MENNFWCLIKFPTFDTKNGILSMFEYGKESVPFIVKKTLLIRGMTGTDKRGAHTHHKTKQVLICISGECKVDMDNGKEKTTITLDKADEGLLLLPYVWHVMHSFAPDTVLLVLADRKYDENEYIRNYEDFIRFAEEINKK